MRRGPSPHWLAPRARARETGGQDLKKGALRCAPGGVRLGGRTSGAAGGSQRCGSGGNKLAALELAIRTAMQHLGGSLLEQLLTLDAGHRGPHVEDRAGHQATFVGYRDKRLDTVLGPIRFTRAYYHCPECRAGTVPRDIELGVPGMSLSPGLRGMVARVAAAGPFAKAKELLSTLAGVELTTKAVERRAEADGKMLQEAIGADAEAIATGAVVPLRPAKPVGRLYVEMDCTGGAHRPRRHRWTLRQGARRTGPHPGGQDRRGLHPNHLGQEGPPDT